MSRALHAPDGSADESAAGGRDECASRAQANGSADVDYTDLARTAVIDCLGFLAANETSQVVEPGVDDRDGHEREQQREQLTAHDDGRHRFAEARADALARDERDHAGDE